MISKTVVPNQTQPSSGNAALAPPARWAPTTPCAGGRMGAILLALFVGLGGVCAADITIGAAPVASTLSNISTRVWTGLGDQVMIAGFITTGSSQMEVGVTGWGPRLADFDASNVLADPTLSVYKGSTLIATNDDWKVPPPTGNRDRVEGKGLAPKYDKESAMVLTLDPGEYTAILSGINNTAKIVGAAFEGDCSYKEGSTVLAWMRLRLEFVSDTVVNWRIVGDWWVYDIEDEQRYYLPPVSGTGTYRYDAPTKDILPRW